MAVLRSGGSISSVDDKVAVNLSRGLQSQESYNLVSNIFKKLVYIALIFTGAILLAYILSMVGPGQASGNQQQSNDSLLNGGSQPTNEDNGQAPSEPTKNSSQTGSNNSSKTSVTINGRAVKVPQNGSYSETINTPNGSATVSGENSQSSSVSGGSVSNSSSTSVNIQSP